MIDQNLPNHRLPVGDHRLERCNRVLIPVINSSRGNKLELHSRLSFEGDRIAKSDQRCDSIEQAAHAGRSRTADILLQHLPDQRRLALGQRSRTKHLIKKAGSSMLWLPDRRVSTRQRKRPKMGDTPKPARAGEEKLTAP